jgi:transcriptional regulator with XRE-family HTH domain
MKEMAKRITDLRESRGENQTEFGKAAGVTQPTVSSWESGDDTPTALSCLLLGLLASGAERKWFFKQIGPDLEAMMLAAEIILKERSAQPLDSEFIRIPCVRKTAQGMEETGHPFLISALDIPDPLSTDCLLVDEGVANPMLAVGDRVVFDKSQSGSKFLRPFWQEMLLIDVDPTRSGTGYIPTAHVVGHGGQALCIGELRCKRAGPPLEHLRTGNNLLYHATLVWHSEPQKAMTQQPHTEIVIGKWQRRIPDLPFGGIEAFEAEAYKDALRKMQPEEGCRILGYVIAWLPAARMKGIE